MAFDDLLAGINESCLSAFGQDFTFTRGTYSEEPYEEPLTVAGILESGVEPEEGAPGDGTVYARLWIQASAIDPAPEKGDEFANATTVYKIMQLQQDAGGGLWLLLRQDRMIE